MEISKKQARRFLLLKHGLIGEYKYHGKDGILDFISDVGCVQYDPIDICGKNHEIVLQSRIEGFNRIHLYELLYKDRVLVDWFDKNMAICLMDDWPYFEHQRVKARMYSRSKPEVDSVSKEVIDYIEKNGPISSSDIKFNEKVDWGWAPTSLARATLDTLYNRGDLVIHHKKGSRKFYDLTAKHISDEIISQCIEFRSKDTQKIMTWKILRRIKSVGMLHCNASYAFIGISKTNAKNRNDTFSHLLKNEKIQKVNVKNISKPFYYSVDDERIMELAISNKLLKKRMEFLAPLDNLLWDRDVIKEVFDFNYKWEIYTPKERRKYGHYVLPILYGAQFIGRIQLIRDKNNGRFKEKIWLCDEVNDNIKNNILKKVQFFSNIMY